MFHYSFRTISSTPGFYESESHQHGIRPGEAGRSLGISHPLHFSANTALIRVVLQSAALKMPVRQRLIDLEPYKEEILYYWKANIEVERVLELLNESLNASSIQPIRLSELQQQLTAWEFKRAGVERELVTGIQYRGYIPQYPCNDKLCDTTVRVLLMRFYNCSDMRGADEAWVSNFEADATVQIGLDTAKGEAEIRRLRARMWEGVQSRTHCLARVFPVLFKPFLSEDGCELEMMLYGSVKYIRTSGQVEVVPWAGHAVMRNKTRRATMDAESKVTVVEPGDWKFAYYRVWLQK